MAAIKDSVSVSLGDVNIERVEKGRDRAADSYLIGIVKTNKIQLDLTGKELYDLARAALAVLQLAEMLPTTFPGSA
jgi:hypothetical protein